MPQWDKATLLVIAAVATLFAAPALAQDKANSTQVPKPTRPQEEAIAAAPLPYREEVVTFENSAVPGVRLVGTLTLPSGSGPHAAAILLAGSGKNDRDETLSGHKPLLVLADALTRQGYAVLRYDKRGAGQSAGNYDAATMADFTSDAKAALAYLKNRPEIDGAKIGFIGHSEGGTIGALVAADDSSVAYVVMMAGFALPAKLLVAEQIRRFDVVEGKPPAEATQTYKLNMALFDAIANAKDQAEAEMRVRQVLAAADPAPAKPEADQALMFARLPAMRFILGYDPTASLRRLRVPVLALAGSKDIVVPPDVNLPALRKALANDPDVTIKELPGLNHFFQHAETGSPREMSMIEETLAPEVTATVIHWIAGHTTARRP